jgi:protein-disulfide isomerase
MAIRLETALSGLTTIGVLGIAAALLIRQLNGEPNNRADRPSSTLTYVDSWQRIVDAGVVTGTLSAPIKVIEFGDLECPYCQKFHSLLGELRAELKDELAFVFVHFPLPNHRFAAPAAEAVECAGQQGRAAKYIDAIFGMQDSLGARPWTRFAQDAGVIDTIEFKSCMSDTTTAARVVAGRTFAQELAVLGTPTVLVNGWRFPGMPSPTDFRRVIRDLVAGVTPAVELVGHGGK